MTAPDSSRGRKRPILWIVGLLLLVALGIATCRRTRPTRLVVTLSSSLVPESTPTPTPTLGLGDGIELVKRDDVAGVIIVREIKTGATAQLRLADYSRENAARAFAQLIATQPATPTPTSLPPPTSTPAPTPLPRAPTATPTPTPPRPAASATSVPPATATPTPTPAMAPLVFAKNLPPFVPLYPDATTLKISSTTANGVTRGSYDFSTADSPEKIGRFYVQKMTDAGLLIIANVVGTNKSGATYTLIAEDSAAGKTLSLTAGTEQAQSLGSITFEAK